MFLICDDFTLLLLHGCHLLLLDWYTVVFLGFKRDANSNLILYYTEKGNTDTFETKDYEHKGGAQWLMANSGHLHTVSSLAAIGSTTRPDGSTAQVGEPKYRFIPSGHLTINI